MMPPVLIEVKKQVGEQAGILKMDVDKNLFYAEKFGMQSISTLIIFKAGKILWRKSGVASSKEILQQLALHSV